MEAPVELEDGPVRDAEGDMRVAMRYIYVATRYIRVRNGITSPILITSMSRNRCGSAEIDQDCSEIVARLCCFPESSFRVTDLPFLEAKGKDRRRLRVRTRVIAVERTGRQVGSSGRKARDDARRESCATRLSAAPELGIPT